MTFRYGLVGTGMVAGVFHRAAAHDPGLAIAGVHARSAEGRARAEAHGAPVHPTLDALLAARPDAVIVATPPDARAAIVAACVRARMPVLAEKPLERTHDAARALVDAMGAVPFGVVLQHRTRPASRAARDLIAGGTMGAVRLLRVDVPWWREPSYYAAPGRGSYARDGGGVLMTQAIHALDLGLWLAGGSVVRVQGAVARALHRLEAEDTATAALTLDTGAVAQVTATTAAFPGRSETVEVHLDGGALTLAHGRLIVARRDGATEIVGEETATGSGADPMAFPHDWHLAVMRDFADAVRDGRPPAIPARAALAVHRVIDAVVASSREGRAVDLTPDPGSL